MGRGFESFRPCQKAEVFCFGFYFFFEKWRRRNGLSPTVLRRLASIVVSLAVFTASDTPCFARAHQKKRLSTIFSSLTFRPCQIRNSRLIRVVSTCCFLFIVKNCKKVLANQGLFCFGGAFRYSRCLYLAPRMPQNAEKHYSPSRCSAFLSLKDRYSLNCCYFPPITESIVPRYDVVGFNKYFSYRVRTITESGSNIVKQESSSNI